MDDAVSIIAGWIEKKDVLNCRKLDEVKKFVKKKR